MKKNPLEWDAKDSGMNDEEIESFWGQFIIDTLIFKQARILGIQFKLVDEGIAVHYPDNLPFEDTVVTNGKDLWKVCDYIIRYDELGKEKV
ncbi:hypothetical protein NST06_10545 [Bacillus sp. FSL P4-0322]|uniref:hypothetical protein n=1 Tax=Bacillus sp. FSL P4-0322 TaxID=2954583 RepID=UPI0030D71145